MQSITTPVTSRLLSRYRMGHHDNPLEIASMDSKTFTVEQIFKDRRQYRVPFYQRPYVWNREDQWGRLWEDIREKAELRLDGGNATPHFMGAVVLEPRKKKGLLGVERHHIIDGQQRLTTLQYVITSLTHALRGTPAAKLLPVLNECLTNPNSETMEDVEVERFKLWPTFRDQHSYKQAMTASGLDELKQRFPASFTQNGALRKIGIRHPPALEAIVFFYDSMIEWMKEPSEAGSDVRAVALATAVLTDLSLVCISLGEDDDAQIIFETLNGHGAELHATDLIRNFIFMRADTNAGDLYNNLWSQFEAPIWAEEQSRGRLNAPRLEWFVLAAVQAQTGEELDIGRLYAGYKRFVDATPGLRKADEQLAMLNNYAEHYKCLVTGSGDGPIARYGRLCAGWDASPTHALALRIAASELDESAQDEIFMCMVSYLVRRAVCGLSRKNYNRVFAQQLKRLDDSSLTPSSFRADLSSMEGSASRWPTDREFKNEWVTGEMYLSRLDPAKLRSVFHALETEMRTEKSEEPIPLAFTALDIDHIMPQSWHAHWPIAGDVKVTVGDMELAKAMRFASDSIDSKSAAILARISAVPRMGNLTLVHYGVNRSYQNQTFATKREQLFEHSNLHLNRDLMKLDRWDEESIVKRGEMLFEHGVRIWPGPG